MQATTRVAATPTNLPAPSTTIAHDSRQDQPVALLPRRWNRGGTRERCMRVGAHFRVPCSCARHVERRTYRVHEKRLSISSHWLSPDSAKARHRGQEFLGFLRH